MNKFEKTKAIRLCRKYKSAFKFIGIYPFLEGDIFADYKVPQKVQSFMINFLLNYAKSLDIDTVSKTLDRLGYGYLSYNYIQRDKFLRLAIYKLNILK
jgi:hypothetical protein